MGKRRQNSDERTPAVVARKPSRPLSQEVMRQIEVWAEEAALANGLVLFDADVNSAWVIRVFVDRPGAIEPGQGVTIDECVAVSRYLETILDADDRVAESYRLEVSSPGVERELTAPRQYPLVLGRRVRVVTRENVDGKNVHEGMLHEADERGFQLAVGEAVLSIEYNNVAKAKLVFEF
jgi:ribosome maturation factor RimP